MAADAPKTECAHVQAQGLDLRGDAEILQSLLSAQQEALGALSAVLPEISRAAQIVSQAILAGGQLYYAAAGSSGLMCLADGAEIPGTFGIPSDQIQICMAGGAPVGALMPGGTEDDGDEAFRAAVGVRSKDIVIAVSASGSTAYPLAFVQRASSQGARVICIANNAGAKLFEHADVAILLDTPAEVIAGSTRLGAATAQKAALNMISTLMGIRLGHVYDGMMVNVVADNKKLLGRAEGIVSAIAQTSSQEAQECLREAGGDVKVAVLIASGALGVEQAKEILEQEHGQLRAALARLEA